MLGLPGQKNSEQELQLNNAAGAVQVLDAKGYLCWLLTSSLSAGVGAGVLGLFLAALSYADEASFFRPAARLAKSPADSSDAGAGQCVRNILCTDVLVIVRMDVLLVFVLTRQHASSLLQHRKWCSILLLP
jgi:hypothetical protein